jgi:solute carrier family 30 (zinc transporter), member 5/7
MSLEFIYGYLSNSLSLIGDSYHMLVDSLALLVGLGASYISKRGAKDKSETLPFGYSKIESLSALFNSLFLISVSYNLFSKSVDRLLHPQKINIEDYDTELIVVSLGGLVINLSGLIFFGDENDSENIHGLFLHVMADTLGSIGVLVSFFLIKNYGLLISDPLCAMLVSVMIFISVLPLLKSSSMSLLGQKPSNIDIEVIREQLRQINRHV